MGPATVLTFNLAPEDFARLRALAASLDIRVKAVPPESFTLPLGAMLGIPVNAANAPAAGENFTEPMLLMCNLDAARFDRFLALLRSPGLPRIPLKAVLTPHNVGWSAIRLHGELRAEHEAMGHAREKGIGKRE